VIILTPGRSFVWRWIACWVAKDVSAQLTGPVRVEWDEEGDTGASLALWGWVEEPVSSGAYTGKD